MKYALSLSGIGCPAGTAGSLQTDPLNGVWVERLGDTTRQGAARHREALAEPPRESVSVVMTVLRDEPGEVFAIICLSTKHRVIAYHEVSRGTLDATLVHPREVFKAALLANAAAIILAHYVPRHIMPLMWR
jgi:DNA repair protein RadC